MMLVKALTNQKRAGLQKQNHRLAELTMLKLKKKLLTMSKRMKMRRKSLRIGPEARSTKWKKRTMMMMTTTMWLWWRVAMMSHRSVLTSFAVIIVLSKTEKALLWKTISNNGNNIMDIRICSAILNEFHLNISESHKLMQRRATHLIQKSRNYKNSVRN